MSFQHEYSCDNMDKLFLSSTYPLEITSLERMVGRKSEAELRSKERLGLEADNDHTLQDAALA